MSDNALRLIIENYYTPSMKEAGAVEVALAMMNMIVSTQRALAGHPDPSGSARIMNDMLFTLPSNPFWQRHGPELTAIMRHSWLAFTNAAEHVGRSETASSIDERDNHRRQALKMREIAIVEMPVAVLAVAPVEDLNKRMSDLRVALLDSGEI